MNGDWNWLRTDLKTNAGTADPGAVYVDNFVLIPLNVVIPKEKDPADIEEKIQDLFT